METYYIQRDDESISYNDWTKNPTTNDTMPIGILPYTTFSDYCGTTLEVSNYNYLKKLNLPYLEIVGGWGTTGIAFLLNECNEEQLKTLEELDRYLENYFILNEDLMSEIESDFLYKFLREEFNDDQETISRVYEIMDKLNIYAIYENSYSAHIKDSDMDLIKEELGVIEDEPM